MTTAKQPETISRGIRLEPETWKAFDKLRKVHGSYNKALKIVLSAGGVFRPSKRPLNDPEFGRAPKIVPSQRESVGGERRSARPKGDKSRDEQTRSD